MSRRVTYIYGQVCFLLYSSIELVNGRPLVPPVEGPSRPVRPVGPVGPVGPVELGPVRPVGPVGPVEGPSRPVRPRWSRWARGAGTCVEDHSRSSLNAFHPVIRSSLPSTVESFKQSTGKCFHSFFSFSAAVSHSARVPTLDVRRLRSTSKR